MIEQRITNMIQQGLVMEVEYLLKMGYRDSLPSMSSIGYNQILQFLKGQLSFESAIEKINSETHRLARHQYAWFRLNDTRINWDCPRLLETITCRQRQIIKPGKIINVAVIGAALKRPKATTGIPSLVDVIVGKQGKIKSAALGACQAIEVNDETPAVRQLILAVKIQ